MLEETLANLLRKPKTRASQYRLVE